MNRSIVNLLFAWLLLTAALAWGKAAPNLVSYQARLTDNAGNPVPDGNYSITFKIYDDPTLSAPANLKWNETQASVATKSGYFNVLLGSVTNLDEAVFSGDNRYLAVYYNSSEIVRSQIAATPYSQRVQTVDAAKGGVISGAITSSSVLNKDANLAVAPGFHILTASNDTSFTIKDVSAGQPMLEIRDKAASLNKSKVQIGPSSATASTVLRAYDVSGNARVETALGPTGAATQTFYAVGTKGAESLGPKVLTMDEVAITAFDAVGNIKYKLINAANGGEVTFNTSSGTNNVQISGNEISLNATAKGVESTQKIFSVTPSKFQMAWSSAKSPGGGLVDYGTNNTFNYNLGGGDQAHAENAVVIGENNIVDSKNVFVVGTSNLVDDDGSGPAWNGDNSVTIGLNNSMKGANSLIFGERNWIGAPRSAAFGYRNICNGGGNNYCFGDSNQVTSTGNSSCLGGNFNVLTVAENSVISGGLLQTLDTTGYSNIGGGYACRVHGLDVSGPSDGRDYFGCVGGGFGNWIVGGRASSISGGYQNGIHGDYATVPGGRLNAADGDYSFAAGRRAIVNSNDDGSFVWADSTDADFNSTAANQFRVRSTGGVNFVTGLGPEVGASLASGSGTWSSLSDRNVKENITTVDDEALLDQLAKVDLRLALPGILPPDPARLSIMDTFLHDAANTNSLSENSVWAIQKTVDGAFWFGTSSGLNRFDPKTGIFKNYSENNGLRNASISCIVDDPDGYLWVTTDNGLARFNPRTETFLTFDKSDGLPSSEFNPNACFRSPSTGYIYVGGTDGFSVYNPQAILRNTASPSVVVTDFKVFNESHAFDPTGKTTVKLNYNQNYFSFDFASLDFHSPVKNTYTYKLDGYDNAWIQAGTRHNASYTGLPSGSYTFHVKGANNDGAWSESDAVVHILIVPPLWKMWQFQVGLGFGLILAVAAGFQWRLMATRANARSLEKRIAERTEELNKANELLREKATQDAVAAERSRLARDLHDAVTQTLFSATLIAEVLPELWEKNRNEGDRRLEELRQLTRGALAEMRTLLVELRPNALVEIPLPTLLKQLTEALIGRARIDIQLICSGERKLPAEVQVGLYRIAQESLNNIVKHARSTQAVITLYTSDTVRLTIADNGVGFDPAMVKPDHIGLRIMRERAELIGADFKVASQPGEGTQISIIWQGTGQSQG